MGVAIFLTTEFGVLDVTSRTSTDIVKVNWLREHRFWTESRLYYAFLWGTILLGTGILLVGTKRVESSFALFKNERGDERWRDVPLLDGPAVHERVAVAEAPGDAAVANGDHGLGDSVFRLFQYLGPGPRP